ncbi:hypothetical protein M2459_002148 [Parabacteroides sp. PF5-5]|uniref:caspase family protein n=1 Tax=unclassified Parabacteroides TaxID=2649774 RepID=UPI0024751D43|nr:MULTISPECIES: caspase family protein [unclassified Parabacteroides]MDH6306835.1 hypothetical protein [Parabacteroides sp. PH5-39]MDH6316281.1 hypothetical protein [Parabacteroides sp. PF5-13]MDH6319764.1 hypothetical protein [Parabacteroides sp. PH5-13]MDH6323645.1 hypothetical protein [Parabacteroides sp. PH5-8]MDH6327468.1 hypothetical protein [Parabacteroides sp. PH5-41]
MNLAILIGVSEYSNGISNLPGCKNDVKAMEELLYSTSKYKDVLVMSENEKSLDIKEKVASLIKKYKGEDVEELFFYFSGHGDFSENEFYYILSDFDTERKTQTSLQNSELDNLIKSLSPQLVIKIVDACHSGVNYIKDISSVNKYIEKTSQEYKSCYFLYSSLNTQYSFQNKNFSFFTISFLNAVKNITSIVRYKDIISFISDEFSSYPEQTPYFVTQADFTDVFCNKNESVDDILNKLDLEFPLKNQDKEVGNDKPNLTTIEEIIRYESNRYVTLDYYKNLLQEIKQKIEGLKITDELKNIYTIRSVFSKNKDKSIDYKIIGKFLASQMNEWFAAPFILKSEGKGELILVHLKEQQIQVLNHTKKHMKNSLLMATLLELQFHILKYSSNMKQRFLIFQTINV